MDNWNLIRVYWSETKLLIVQAKIWLCCSCSLQALVRNTGLSQYLSQVQVKPDGPHFDERNQQWKPQKYGSLTTYRRDYVTIIHCRGYLSISITRSLENLEDYPTCQFHAWVLQIYSSVNQGADHTNNPGWSASAYTPLSGITGLIMIFTACNCGYCADSVCISRLRGC
jgi:hypothetical protein